MFELSAAKKYLIPKRKQLSVSLIALMSVFVISLVVWLLLVFLSVMQGIERNWMEKVTSLNAPLKITPTPAYFSSYYYQVDGISLASNYTNKSIGEKAAASSTDPYNATEDREPPAHWAPADRTQNGDLKDPVKLAFKTLAKVQKDISGFIAQEYELGGAMMKIEMQRPSSPHLTMRSEESHTFITQVSYVASLPDESPYIDDLLLGPSLSDLNHLLYLTNHQTRLEQHKYLTRFFENVGIEKLKTSLNYWHLPHEFIPEGAVLTAKGHYRQNVLSHLSIPLTKDSSEAYGRLKKENGVLYFESQNQKRLPLSPSFPLIVEKGMTFAASLDKTSLEKAAHLTEVRFSLAAKVQDFLFKGNASLDGLEIDQAKVYKNFETSPSSAPFWAHAIKFKKILPTTSTKESGVLIAKSFQDNGVKIGDKGYLSYSVSSSSSVQEQRLPIYVAGFYDPGIMPVGNKCVLAPKSIAHQINSSSNSYLLDRSQANGIQVWFKEIEKAQEIKAKISQAFEEAGIAPYWTITAFQDYDFAKDLLQQFQSDKYLFTLLGVIILIIACCNIISLLVLLVNDKKKEIAILQAMGASTRSVAFIFGSCGMIMGFISSFIGTAGALLTLQHIDKIVRLLSAMQGHNAFNPAFYGTSLPNQLSHEAVVFVLIATPILALLAGLVPALKACRLKPAYVLRSE